ncbi:hypothetical protein H839_12904 [Parageobacillus genomosp. 1]|uniref:Uncharacterized protein n=1 Tax=Parageobacillus genomosp. 1 TaxID=1295642 RepID=A0ABC9VD55_9BACL|nr:hypothetical protein [Parageobacillus genomosp. 1]EZP76176.1 hypothetical protein H839_12904 [Parageobacillus genomosp. 1]
MFAPAPALAAAFRITGVIHGDGEAIGCPLENKRDRKPPNPGRGKGVLMTGKEEGGILKNERGIGEEGNIGGRL